MNCPPASPCGASIARTVVALALMAAVGAAAEASAAGRPATGNAAHPLIMMRQVRPITITPQTVTVDNGGEAAVIVVIGELTIPKPVRFRLSPMELAHLRQLIAHSGVAHLQLVAPFPVRALMYTIIVGNHSVRVDEGHVPHRLRPLIAFLHALIIRHY